MPGHNHGKSIKNPRVYEALRRKGYSKSKAAAISNALVGRGKSKKRGAMAREREYRQVPAEYTMDKGKPGRIIADVLNYDVLDDYGTMFAPDVFKESMDRRMPRICWGHDWRDPLGQYIDREDNGKRLRLIGDLDLDMIDGTNTPAVPSAHRAYAQLKSGTIDEFSVGFVRQNDERAAKGGGVRITRGILDETSPVLVGSVPGTKLVSIRSRTSAPRMVRAAMPDGSALYVPADLVQSLLVRYESGEIDLGDAIQELKHGSLTFDELPEVQEFTDSDEEPEAPDEEPDEEYEEEEGWDTDDLDEQLANLGLTLDPAGEDRVSVYFETRGDHAGHAFHGNQHSKGGGGGGGAKTGGAAAKSGASGDSVISVPKGMNMYKKMSLARSQLKPHEEHDMQNQTHYASGQMHYLKKRIAGMSHADALASAKKLEANQEKAFKKSGAKAANPRHT